MTRIEFLQLLEESLEGEIPATEVQSNIKYYDEYIKSQTVLTGSEEAAVAALGNPQMIAKSVIEAFKASGEPSPKEYYHSFREGDDSGYTQTRETFDSQQTGRRQHSYHVNLPGWVVTLIGVLLFCIVFYFLFWIGGIAIKILLRFGLPLLCIYLGYRLLVDWRHR